MSITSGLIYRTGVDPAELCKMFGVNNITTRAFLDTFTQRELQAFLKRGGVIAGNSAGAIIQGLYTIRGNPEKPGLMVKGSERGFAFLPNVAVNPHLTEAMRQNELVTIIDAWYYWLNNGDVFNLRTRSKRDRERKLITSLVDD